MGETIINVALLFFQWTTAPGFPTSRKAVIVRRVISNWKINSTTPGAQALKNQFMWFFPAASERTFTNIPSDQRSVVIHETAPHRRLWKQHCVLYIPFGQRDTEKWHLWSRAPWQRTNLWHLVSFSQLSWEVNSALPVESKARGLGGEDIYPRSHG